MAFLPLSHQYRPHHPLPQSQHLPYAPSLFPIYPSHPPNALFPPSFMDAGPNSNNTSGASPSTSNASALSATVVSAPTSTVRKKQGRGPGKKDLKDRPTVSVRWDDGDLTERLIIAVESNERWQGVFYPSSNEPGQVRASAPVAKRDLQREIARHLFQADSRYDLDDRKVLESLAVSVKNKLFKITTLYTECKQELGQISTLKDERDLPPGSEIANTWARVKEKFPQFIRIRDLMNKIPAAPNTPRLEDPISPTVEHSSSTPTALRTRSSVAPILSGQVPQSNHSSSLKGAVDLPRDAPSYIDTSTIAFTSSMTNSVTSPTYSIQQSSNMQPSGYQPQRRMTGPMPTSTGPPRSGSGMVGMPPSIHQPQPQHYSGSASLPPTSPHVQRPTPYTRPPVQIPTAADLGALDAAPQSPEASGHPPSPPLSQTIQQIVSTLTEKKDRERSRAHELEVLRMKREESERVRWHQREMMRLKIQLIRAERAATGNVAMASTTPAAGPSHLGSGGVEDDLALAAGLGDDMSLEGDGEGELDEEIFDPEPARGGRQGGHPQHLHHHHPGGNPQ